MGTNPCIIGVATHTWRGLDAPEPLEMWAEVVADAALDSDAVGIVGRIDSLEVVYCQTWQYDDAAWFPIERGVNDICATRADNRMVGYPYTKYMMAVMDVDMAAALIVASEEAADRLCVPR